MTLQEANSLIDKLHIIVAKSRIEKEALINKISKKQATLDNLKYKEKSFLDKISKAKATILHNLGEKYKNASEAEKAQIKKEIQRVKNAGQIHDNQIKIKYKDVGNKLRGDIKELFKRKSELEKSIQRFEKITQKIIQRKPLLTKAGKVGAGMVAASGVALGAATYSRYRKLEKERADRLKKSKNK